MNSAIKPGKVYYLDNIKILLTVLVIIHHAMVTYGAPGSWYYNEKSSSLAFLIPMTMIVGTNQSFFMGFFFFMAAFFTEASLKRKGTNLFVKDRLIRLGIPLIFYSFILSPVMNYIVAHFGHDKPWTFPEYLSGYDDWISFGVLWFVAALLFFSLVFIIVRSANPSLTQKPYPLPSNNRIIGFSVVVGLITFVVRIFFPTGWTFWFLGWQFAHFPQYIALFCLGIIASRNNWLTKLSWEQGKKFIPFAIILFLVGYPGIYGAMTITKSDVTSFGGLITWQSAVYSVFEQVIGFSIIVALISIGKKKWNVTTPALASLSRSSFAAYIFHPLILISISVILKNWPVDPGVKMLVCAPLAVVLTFALARIVVAIPGVNKII